MILDGFSWGDVIEGIAVAIVIGLLAFFGRLWRKSVYGKMDELDKKVVDVKNQVTEVHRSLMAELSKKQEKEICCKAQAACQRALSAEFHLAVEGIKEHQTMIVERLNLLISRLDKHIDRE